MPFNSTPNVQKFVSFQSQSCLKQNSSATLNTVTIEQVAVTVSSNCYKDPLRELRNYSALLHLSDKSIDAEALKPKLLTKTFSF